jgi:hypothetical protein
MSVLLVDLDGVLRIAGSVLSSQLLVDTGEICLMGMPQGLKLRRQDREDRRAVGL